MCGWLDMSTRNRLSFNLWAGLVGHLLVLESFVSLCYAVSPGDFFAVGNLAGALKKIELLSGVTVSDVTSTTAETSIRSISGLGIDASANLIIADQVQNKVLRLNSSGHLIAEVTDGISHPFDVAVDATGNYVVTQGSDGGRLFGIYRITPAGVGGLVTDASPLTDPTHIVIDAAGNYIVTDRNGHKLLRVTPQGQVSTIYEHTARLQGVAIDTEGRYVLGDPDGDQILRVTEGCPQPVEVIADSLPGVNPSPGGLAVAASGEIVYGDFDQFKLFKISPGEPGGEILELALDVGANDVAGFAITVTGPSGTCPATPTQTETPFPPSPTETPAPPTPTATETLEPTPPPPTPTDTPVPPTATKTGAPPSPTTTSTPIPPTHTVTETPLPPTPTQTPSQSPSSTPSPTSEISDTDFDLTGDEEIDAEDMLLLLESFRTGQPVHDFDHDGSMNCTDLLLMATRWQARIS